MNGTSFTREEDVRCKQYDELNVCKVCDVGFHLDINLESCIANVCHCESGKWDRIEINGNGSFIGSPKLGIECVYHDLEYCDSCPSGMHLLSVDLTLSSIYQHYESDSGGEISFESEMCSPNYCHCQNGVAFDYSDFDDSGLLQNPGISMCDSHSAERCQSCDSGYHLEEYFCVPNV